MALLPVGSSNRCELYCEPQAQGVADGQAAFSMTDYSGKNRHLTEPGNPPVFKTNILGGKSVVRFSGEEPLKNADVFTVNCGWIVAGYNGAIFPDYKGLLSGVVSQDVLTGNTGGNTFFDFQIPFYEFRSNDRIYPAVNAPAPMNEFKIIFFRFWKPVIMGGVQLGQQRGFTDRRWLGDVALVALYSRNFCESDIRMYSNILAANFGLALADVYPYQADSRNTPETVEQSVNFYDPPEGDRISEVLSGAKRVLELKFSTRRTSEIEAMKAFHNSHYAQALPFIYRNYKSIPPSDIEGYIDSPYELDGAVNNFSYAFRIRER